jgi:hypothetical protein
VLLARGLKYWSTIKSLKRELQVAFETDPHLHGLDLGEMPKRIKIEVDEQEPEQEPEYPEYPGCEYFDGRRVDEDEDDEEDFYSAPVLNIYDAQDCVDAAEYSSCNCMNCAAVNQSNGFAEAAQVSVVKPSNVAMSWPIGDDIEDPIARGLDFNSDVGWIRPKMVRNGW